MVLVQCTSRHRDLSTYEVWCGYLLYFLCYAPDIIMTDRRCTDKAVAICCPIGEHKNHYLNISSMYKLEFFIEIKIENIIYL